MNLDKIVVTSPDSRIESHVNNNYDSQKVIFIKRPKNLAQINKDLKDSVTYIMKDERLKGCSFDCFLLMFLEYPFVTSNIIDDAIRTMAIFELDSLISVRQDNSLYYRHDGKGMKAINDQDKFTRIEREAIYKFSAGLILTKFDLFKSNNSFVGERAGHIEVNQQAALSLDSDFDIKIAKMISTWELKSVN